jgi:hypothetical protein
MTYERFEDTPVWKAAQELGLGVFGLVDDRAGSSTSRAGRPGKFATASTLPPDWPSGGFKSEISDLESEMSKLLPRCESVSRQLRGWADSLQNTDGQRHLNDTSRAAWGRTAG